MNVSVRMEEIRPIRTSRRVGSKSAAAQPATAAVVATNVCEIAGQTQIRTVDIEPDPVWASRVRVHNRCTERPQLAMYAGSPRRYQRFRSTGRLDWGRVGRADPVARLAHL